MTPDEVDTVANALHEGWLTGSLATAPPLPEVPISEALAVQLAVLDRHLEAGERLGGWKVGMTSGAARDRLGPGVRPFGYLLQSRVHENGAVIPLLPNGPTGIEPELAFQLGAPLSGDVGPEDVAAAVESVIPAFELQQHRLPRDTGHGVIVADDLSQWGTVFGAPQHWTTTAAEVEVELWRDGAHLLTSGPGYLIDEPLEAIAVLCRGLHQHGQRLEAGHRIITGAFHQERVRAPGSWRAVFKGIGPVAAEFT